MKKIIITLAVAALALFSANAAEKTKVYDFGNITDIDANFLYNIHVTEGKSDKVTLVYDDMIENFLDLEVSYKDGALRLSRNVRDRKSENKFGKWMSNSERKRVEVYLEMDNIKSIRVSGAAHITFEGTYKADELDIDVNGASSLKGLQVNGKSMEVDCSGASKLSVTGNFSKEVEIEVSGAGSMTYSGDSEKLEAYMSGASSFDCNGKFNTCDIKCSGASKAQISGKGHYGDFDCSGASRIDAEDFSVKKAEVELTGASSLKINVSDELQYNVSTASKMTYYGDPALVNKSASSNVVKGR